MSNDNGTFFLHPALVKRDYTPAIAIEDITMQDGAVIPKDSDVCILSMTYGVEEGTEQIRMDKIREGF